MDGTQFQETKRNLFVFYSKIIQVITQIFFIKIHLIFLSYISKYFLALFRNLNSTKDSKRREFLEEGTFTDIIKHIFNNQTTFFIKNVRNSCLNSFLYKTWFWYLKTIPNLQFFSLRDFSEFFEILGLFQKIKA